LLPPSPPLLGICTSRNVQKSYSLNTEAVACK
jgi:hypothetical protein